VKHNLETSSVEKIAQCDRWTDRKDRTYYWDCIAELMCGKKNGKMTDCL